MSGPGPACSRQLLLITAVAFVVLAAGCARRAGDAEPSSAVATATESARSTAPREDGLRIVAYGSPGLLGAREANLATLLAQGKPVVVNFWAGLCPPCRAEMPAFQRVYEQHREAVIFVGVDVGMFTGLGTQAEAQRLLRELGITYPTGYATSAQVLAEYRVTVMPTTLFFGPNGREVRRHAGFLTEGELREQVSSLATGP